MKVDRIIIMAGYIFMALQMISFFIFLKQKNISMKGNPPINKILFILSKAASFMVWIIMFLQAAGVLNSGLFKRPLPLTILSLALFSGGVFLQFISFLYLGKNVKFGIPEKNEEAQAVLRLDGPYRFSRNPMYTGFILSWLSACVYTLNPAVWVLSVFAISVHHGIVLKEEKFLIHRFEQEWKDYSTRVRRYI